MIMSGLLKKRCENELEIFFNRYLYWNDNKLFNVVIKMKCKNCRQELNFYTHPNWDCKQFIPQEEVCE